MYLRFFFFCYSLVFLIERDCFLCDVWIWTLGYCLQFSFKRTMSQIRQSGSDLSLQRTFFLVPDPSTWSLWLTKWCGTGFSPNSHVVYRSWCLKNKLNGTHGRKVDSFHQMWCTFGSLGAFIKRGASFVFKSLTRNVIKCRKKQRGYCLLCWGFCLLSALKQEEEGFVHFWKNIPTDKWQ